MNIGIFTDTFYPQISGVDTCLRILTKGLRSLGHRPIIFTTTDPGAREKQQDVFRLPSFPFVFLPSRRVAFFIQPTLLAKMKGFKLDIVHTHTEFTLGLFGKMAADIMGLPHLHTYHTMYENYTHYVAGGRLITPGAARHFSRLFCNGADAVTTPTEKVRELLLQYGVRKPIYSVPTGIDFSQFLRANFTEDELRAAKDDLGVNHSDPVILTVGRVAKEKSMDVVIKAMPLILQRLPHAKYVSVGDGPYVTELKTLAKSLGVADSVVFAGPRKWETIGKYYQTGDVFVSASTSETQGIVYVEAMAARVPLAVKRDKSVEDLLLHGRTGMFFDTAEELAERVIELLGDAALCAALTENAYNHIQSMSADIFVKRMEGIYADMVDSHNRDHTKKGLKLPLRLRRPGGK